MDQSSRRYQNPKNSDIQSKDDLFANIAMQVNEVSSRCCKQVEEEEGLLKGV